MRLAILVTTSAAAAVLSLYPTQLGTAGDDPPIRDGIELLVRGPDGQPVAHSEVRLLAIQPDDRGTREDTARTDAAGLVQFRRPYGVNRFRVVVPGVGYGYTGIVEIGPGRISRAPLPRLVPFGVIEGTVPPEVLGPNAVVEVSGGHHGRQSLKVGADGRFRAEVPADWWWVVVTEDKRRVASVSARVPVAPGQTVTGVTVRRLPPEERPAQSPLRPTPEKREPVTWAKGVVRDTVGRPIAGAKVWAVAVYSGNVRMMESIRKATTDAEGRYEIQGEGRLLMFSASLVAHVAGRPPALAWLQDRGGWVFGGVDTAPTAPTVDLVIPDRDGRLHVTLVEDGKPAAGVAVGLWMEGANLREAMGSGGITPARQEVEAVVHPVTTADAAGVARFDGLLPGRYRMIASASGEGWVRSLGVFPSSHPGVSSGYAESVPVAVGRTTSHRMSIGKWALVAGVRVCNADGAPISGKQVPVEFTAVGSIGGGNRSEELTADGLGWLRFDRAGLWQVSFKYRDERTTSVRTEPYYSAEGVVAVSPRLPAAQNEPARGTARRIEPGSVVVELKDLAGRPARGYVELAPESVGSTDETGTVRFDGMVPFNSYTARAYLAGRPVVDIGEQESPVPDERQLRGTSAVLTEPVAVERETERRIVLREQPVGYILGTLRPPPNRGTKDFNVYLTDVAYRSGARAHYRASTGELAAGPFPPGETRLRLMCSLQPESLAQEECAVRDVKIEAGSVTKVELTPPADWPRPINGLEGQVFLPGGKGPALGAVVTHFPRPGERTVPGGMTDASGRIRTKTHAYSTYSTGAEPTGGALVVANLPGSHGATVVTAPNLRQPLRMVLPAPLTLRGRVTVAGVGVSGDPGRIRALASYDGPDRARLGRILDVQATAQEDGSFELAGLTPVRYTIQAALDDIWLSPSVAVDVADPPLDPLTLAIPHPGGAAVVKVVDADGKPVLGHAVIIDRPAGPLSTLLWPAEFKTDGAGEARIPALEAGRHTVRVKETDVSAEIVMTALPVEKPVEVQLRVPAGGRR